MMWLTWRQSRLEGLIGGAVLLALAALLIKTGTDMASAYAGTGVGHCLHTSGANEACASVVDTFRSRFDGLVGMLGWLNFTPLLIGIILGAPFVLELETGTYRLAWTQSITRMRWLTVRLVVVVLAAIVIGALFAALMTWWRGPYDHLDGRFGANEAFDLEGIVPIAYVVFALALVLFLGTLLRRTIPAVVGSFVAFLALRLWIAANARTSYQAPLLTRQGAGRLRDGGAWILSSDWVDRHGRTIADSQVFGTCSPRITGGVPDKHAFVACLQRHGFAEVTRYQPAGRFWTFQIVEAAIFFGLAAALLAGVVLWIRYRMT